MDIITKVINTIKKHALLRDNQHILVALSGGADSVCLLRILNELKAVFKISLSAVYINHGLRPDEAPHEIAFCTKLCAHLSVPLYTRDIVIANKKSNLQEQARILRLQALNDIATEISAHKIAIAHQADDQFETILMRLCTGAGSKGLSGIPIVRDNIIRPLLYISRQEIERFHKLRPMAILDMPYVTDSSNRSKHYVRNRIRHTVIPELKKIYPELLNTIIYTSDILAQEDKYLDIITTKTMMHMVSRKSDDFIELFLLPLKSTEKVIARRVLRRAIEVTNGLKSITYNHIEDILDLIKNGKSGDRLYLPHDIRVVVKYSTLLITSQPPVKLSDKLIKDTGEYPLFEIKKLICISPASASQDRHSKDVAYLDADKIKFPITVRCRTNGDYFFPSGFGRRKKIQDFFVDEKVPRDERDSVPLIVNANGEIIWIAGMRTDDRFIIDKTTQRVLKFQIVQMKQ